MKNKNTRPNIIVIVTDQQKYNHVGYSGNVQVKTPNIDKLALSGSWFEKFYVASPVCMSNRASFMTGRMPSVNGVRFNGISLEKDSVTFVDLLAGAGYHTALIGKCHLQGNVDVESFVKKETYPVNYERPSKQFDEARRSQYSDKDYRTEIIAQWRKAPETAVQDIQLPYYGFKEVDFCIGHGDTMSGHYQNWKETSDPDSKGKEGMQFARKTSEVNAPQTYQPWVEEDVYPTRYIENRTIEWLKAHKDKINDNPFFLQVSFPDPHHPFTPPGKYWDMYNKEDIQLPRSFYQPNKTATPPVEQLWEQFESGIEPPRWVFPFVSNEEKAKDIFAKTYGQISMIDDAIGSIYSTLETLDLVENTVICFMSDHGDYMGDHALMLKGPMNYESIIRVPFFWHDCDPKYNSGKVTSLGSTLDLAKTILERVEIRPYNGIQGENLLPVIAGEEGNRRQILIENSDILINKTESGYYFYLGFDDVVNVTTLVDKVWKISVWQGFHWGELYHLKDDPDELNNLWEVEEYQLVKHQLLVELVHSMQRHVDKSPHPRTVA